ncbi:hypothetical protein BKP45_12630 [Anaerobacillus alkalidiazotrophicus]|uniref:Uncharacterized protein n=1 Tax=Anaerobacillus alkalidiazotrophicus TaxID=472963 RepID=A0A1S2M1W4_9BACI|nr:hypothetical protein [Anaerobacillus alkalidiazotrophicus]OIJ18413.1 hypothetical protein BKP45_18345 [Anaerobacillus alkalidiazotrophicus]OIJ19892.1 hypothetical protein BKP45_12630 [Anaerobacillus alkalidiazotrophicus]
MKQLIIHLLIITLFFTVGCQQIVQEDTLETEIIEKENDTEKISEDQGLVGDKEVDENSAKTILFEYLPLQVGYKYDVVHAMDGLGEGIEVLYKDNDRFFVRGHYGSALGFYRVYEVREDDIAIVFEVTEEDLDLYEEMATVSEASDLYDLPIYNEKIVLSLPIKEKTTWSGGEIIETDAEVTINDVTYETIIVDYEEDIAQGYYYAKGKGLVQIVYVIPELSEEPLIAQMIE